MLLAPALAAPLGSPFGDRRKGGLAALGGIGPSSLLAAAGYARLPVQPMPTVPDVRLRLVQPSIQQSLKWVEGREAENIRQHIELSEQQPAGSRPNVIIWPEAAEPFPLEPNPEDAKALGSMVPAGGQLLITGIFRQSGRDGPPTYHDSIQALDPARRIVARPTTSSTTCRSANICRLRRWLPFLKAVAAAATSNPAGAGPATIRLPGSAAGRSADLLRGDLSPRGRR